MTMIHEAFERQRQYSLREKFERSQTPRQFFFEHDALHNLEEDLVFSILGRYHCGSKCKVCFLDETWLSPEALKPFIPAEADVGPDWEALVLSVFDHFSQIACIDDLKLIQQHSHLFAFYRKHSERMDFYTTDNGLFSNFSILMEELRFRGLGQLSLSDAFLSARSGKNAVEVVNRLEQLHKRSPLRRLNFIVTQEMPEKNPWIRLLVDWAEKNAPECSIYFHNDIRAKADFCGNFRGEGYQEPSCYHIVETDQSFVNCSILTETLHLRHRSFFPDLYESMKPGSIPFYEIGNSFEPEKLLPAVLESKATLYRRHAQLMEASIEGATDLSRRLQGYFQDVGGGLRVHKDYNFIPIVMLSPKSRIYQALTSSGFVNTHAGLIRPNSKNVVPIASMEKSHV